MSLGLGVTAAYAQGAPNLWSIQFHGGLFAPIDANGSSPIIGMRYSKHYNGHVQGGLLTGFASNSKRLDAPIDALSRESVELARVDAHLVPLMGFMQVNFTEKAWLVPFVGIGGGYEWLNVDAKDHRTGQAFTTTYGNVAWETYGGVGLRLTSKVRVNGELFYNGGSLERSVFDASGRKWREAVSVNGVGARVGLDMVFE
jgi:hypothetical protein